MTIATALGEIQATLDLSRAPCTAASFAFLGGKGFFNNTTCHRLNTELFYLACGDPRGDGSGGPSYQFANEDVPPAPISSASAPPSSPPASPPASASPSPSVLPVYYPKGTIVMSNKGADTNGSLFYIIYDDGSTLNNAYSIVGTVVKGLDIVERVAKGGALNPAGNDAAEGRPKTEVLITALTVGPPPTPTPTPTPSAPASPTPSATAQS
jgi:peptidyl-prolyl cis-trans isomerase B (cyclophilin B)